MGVLLIIMILERQQINTNNQSDSLLGVLFVRSVVSAIGTNSEEELVLVSEGP